MTVDDALEWADSAWTESYDTEALKALAAEVRRLREALTETERKTAILRDAVIADLKEECKRLTTQLTAMIANRNDLRQANEKQYHQIIDYGSPATGGSWAAQQ